MLRRRVVARAWRAWGPRESKRQTERERERERERSDFVPGSTICYDHGPHSAVLCSETRCTHTCVAIRQGLMGWTDMR